MNRRGVPGNKCPACLAIYPLQPGGGIPDGALSLAADHWHGFCIRFAAGFCGTDKMENSSYVAISRQATLWRQMEVVANNMANVNTPAFKSEQSMFADQLVRTKADYSPFGSKVAFVRDVGVLRDTQEGPMSKTDNPLDVAIHGNGYFTIDTPSGSRYTRDGHFRLDENGMVVTTAGFPVLQGNGNPIVLAPNESKVTIAGDGTVSTENGQIAKIQVVRFANEQTMRKAGDNSYLATETPTPVDRPDLVQGMVEESNVQAVSEMTNMMSILRSYEGVQSLIQNEHDLQMKAMPVLSGSQQTA
jgi:flagellar basal-body rod protein FlgF